MKKNITTLLAYSGLIWSTMSIGIALGSITVESETGANMQQIWVGNEWSLATALFALMFFAYTAKHKLTNRSLERRVLSSHVTTQVLGGMALLLGIYTSVTSSAILTWLFPLDGHVGRSTLGIDVVLGLILTVLVGFIKHGIHATKQANEKDKEETANLEKLHDTIRLAPPKSFPERLAYFSNILEDFSYTQAGMVYEQYGQLTPSERLTYGNSYIDKYRILIRAGLVAFSRLAGMYDNAPATRGSNIRYRANLMLNINNQNQDIIRRLTRDNQTFERRFEIGFNAEPSFLLVLDKQLSVLIDSEDVALIEINNEKKRTHEDSYEPIAFEYDQSVNNATFPVYLNNNNPSHDNFNMIGAPQAIAKGESQYIRDTVIESSAMNGFPEFIASAARTYFANDRKGRSIVSMPITLNRFLRNDPADYNGVVNIYRNEPDIFSGNVTNFRNFEYFTQPMQTTMARLLAWYMDIVQDLAELEALNDKQPNNTGKSA